MKLLKPDLLRDTPRAIAAKPQPTMEMFRCLLFFNTNFIAVFTITIDIIPL